MSTAVVRNAAGTEFTVTNTVRNAAGASFDVDAYVRNAAGTPYLIFGDGTPVVEDADVGGAGKRKYDRYNVSLLRHEDEVMLDMIKRFLQ